MAADTTIKVEVDSSQAQQNLQTLQQKFAGLKSAILGIGISALITQANQLADSIQDLSDATEVSTDSILGFSRAVSASGGTFDGAQKAIAKLVLGIDEAASKSGETRAAFMDVGLSLKELQTLSTQDIFKKTVEGLAKIDDVSKRNRLSVQLLGKEFRAVNIQSVGQGFGQATSDSGQFASAIKSSADAADRLSAAFTTFQLQLLKALQPINEFIAALDPKQIAVVTQTIIDIAKALALLFVATKIAGAVKFLIDSFRVLGGAAVTTSGILKNAAAGITALKMAFDPILVGIQVAATRFGVLSIMLRAVALAVIRLGPLIAALYAGFLLLDGVVELLTGRNLKGWFDEAAAGLEKFVRNTAPGLADALDRLGQSLGMGISPEAQRANEQETQRFKNRAESAKKLSDELKRGEESQKKIAEATAKARLESRQSVEILGENLSKMGMRIQFEKNILGLTDDEREMAKAIFDLEEQRIDKIAAIGREIQKLKQDRAALKADEIEQSAILSARIKILQDEAAQVNEVYTGHKQGIRDQIQLLQSARMIEEDRRRTIENTTRAIEDQISRQQNLGDILRGIMDQQRSAQFEGTQIGRTPFERQLADIKENARKAALEAGRAFAAAFEDSGDGLTPERAAELQRGLDAIAAAYASVANEQIANLQASRSWSAGWAEAYNQYVENANDAASKAKTYFETFTRGFEDAIVRFVQTGKLSFKDLVNTMIAEFARLQAQKMFLALFGDKTGGGMLFNLFNFGKSLFGFANGGQVQAGRPAIVGERGPEMFLPFTNGRIIPNNQLGGGGGSAGTTNVVYNIQAVDAQSFRSLVARDPAFIYAVTERGRQSQPSRRFA